MRAVAENLRQILICPPLWFRHLLGAALCLAAFLYPLQNAVPEEGHFTTALFLPTWSAFIVASLQKEILLKPFVFALPDHRGGARRTLLLLGTGVSLLSALTILAYPGLGSPALMLAAWSFACLAFAIYLIVVAWVYWMANAAGLWGLLLGTAYLLVHFPSTRIALEDMALLHPLVNTALAALGTVLLWRMLGSHSLSRRMCDSRFLSLQSSWSTEALRRYGLGRKIDALRKHGGAAFPGLERLFLASLQRYPALSMKRCLSGCRYRTIGDFLPCPLKFWAWGALFWIVILTVAGYVPGSESRPKWSGTSLIMLAPCILGARLTMPTFSTLLLPAGRRERFWATLATAVQGALLTLVLTLLICLFWLLPDHMESAGGCLGTIPSLAGGAVSP